MDAGTAAGVEPEVKAIAVLQSRLAAPGKRFFPTDVDHESDGRAIPSHADIRVDAASRQAREYGQSASLRQIHSGGAPIASVVENSDFKAEQEYRIDERIVRWGRGSDAAAGVQVRSFAKAVVGRRVSVPLFKLFVECRKVVSPRGDGFPKFGCLVDDLIGDRIVRDALTLVG